MFRTDLITPISPLGLMHDNNISIESVNQLDPTVAIISVVLAIVITFIIYKKTK